MVRAKFKVTAITTTQITPTYATTKVRLEAQYDPKLCAEDVTFSKATPTGHLEMQVDNPAALAQLPIGGYFYVDLTPVE